MWYSQHIDDDRKPQLWNKNDKVSLWLTIIYYLKFLKYQSRESCKIQTSFI